MVAHTSSSSYRGRNGRARLSLLFALLSLASIPVAYYAKSLPHVTLTRAVAAEAVAGTLFGLLAVIFARKARYHVERSLGRTGEGTARWGKWLGLLGLCLGITAALALGFFGLLLLQG